MPPTRQPRQAPERIDRFRGTYAFLSNFHRAPFDWRAKTAEAAFQAAKIRDAKEAERIRMAPSSAQAKRPPR